MPPLLGYAKVGGLAGTLVAAPVAMLSDAGWAVLGGILTAVVTTTGSVLIAYINRPSRPTTAATSKRTAKRPKTPPSRERSTDEQNLDEQT